MLKRRIHFFEIEDLSFCPAVIRDGITDVLQFSINRVKYYEPITPLLASALRKTQADKILDLCSGGGGPWPSLLPSLSAQLSGNVRVLLTDRYPNIKAFEQTRATLGDQLEFEAEGVSAFDVPADLHGFRTVFTGLHHFRPEHARMILADAVQKGDGIGVFEFTHRSARGIGMTLLAPIGTAVAVLLMRPVRLSRVLLTFLLPVLPVCALFDGVVSSLRTYSIEELQDLVDSLPENDYTWDIGELPGGPTPVTYLIGRPESHTA